MKVHQLRALLRMSRTWPDATLHNMATLPKHQQTDYLDRVIVAIAKGEAEWRAT